MDITIVRKENRSFFEPLMPQNEWEDADLVLGAIDGGTACGILAAKAQGTILNLQYLYVAEGCRRKGIATKLLENLHEIGKEGQMDGEICRYLDNERTRELNTCLSHNRYEQDEPESPVYAVAFGDLSERFFGSAQSGADAPLPSGIRTVPLSDASGRMWNQFLEELGRLPNEDGSVPDIGMKHRYEQEASFLLTRGGEPAGCILWEKPEESYILSYFCVLNAKGAAEMMGLFCASYRVLKENCSLEDKLYINALTETTRKMVMQMTDQKAQSVGNAVCRYYTY